MGQDQGSTRPKCSICGKEIEPGREGVICRTCQDRIRSEAAGKRSRDSKQPEKGFPGRKSSVRKPPSRKKRKGSEPR